jgi:hypothetical protein
MARFGFEFVTRFVEIDLLRPEFERCFTSFETDDLQAHDPPIEVAGGPNILHGQDKMIDRVNPENLPLLFHVCPKSP